MSFIINFSFHDNNNPLIGNNCFILSFQSNTNTQNSSCFYSIITILYFYISLEYHILKFWKFSFYEGMIRGVMNYDHVYFRKHSQYLITIFSTEICTFSTLLDANFSTLESAYSFSSRAFQKAKMTLIFWSVNEFLSGNNLISAISTLYYHLLV